MRETFDVRLIDSTYSVTPGREGGDEVVVKLFGKTRDDRSITILCPDFKPYFHVYDPAPELAQALRESPDVLTVEDAMLEYKGSREKFAKVTVRAPWMVPRFRGQYELKHKTITLVDPPGGLLDRLRAETGVLEAVAHDGGARVTTEDRVYSQRLVNRYGLLALMEPDEAEKFRLRGVFFAADIVFTNRFIYDHDLEACVRVTGEAAEKGGEYTTDLTVRADLFERCEAFTPKLKIMSFDIESSIRYHNIYCICLTVIDERDGSRQDRRIFSEFGAREPKMTEEERKARDEDERRILREFVREVRALDPDVITGYNINNFDLAVLYERAGRLFGKGDARRRASGDELAFGRDRLGMGRRENRTTGFVTWDVKGRLVLDGWLSVKKELRPKREGLGYVSSLLFNDTKENIDSSRIDDEWRGRRDEVVHYCLKDADLALRVLTHPRIQAISKLMDLAIPARLPVKEVAGGQNRMIESLLIRMVDREGVAVPMSSGEVYDYEGGFVYETKPGLWEWVIGLDFSSMYPSQVIKHNICFTSYTRDRAEAAHVSPVGAAFLPAEKRHGIVPRMVEGLLSSRKQAKEAMRKAKEDGDAAKADYYNRLQNAIKIMANATYGYFGTKFCRWPYNRYIAPSITAWAREEIRTVVDALEARGFTVIAGDTDSVFFTSKECRGLEKCREVGGAIQREFSAGNMHLELEKVMVRFFAHAKKRYFGKIVWPEESLLVRGYEPRRTDSFDLQSDTMTKVFQLVLDGRPDDAVAYARDTVHDTLKGKVARPSLVISKSVGEFDSYDNPDSLVHVAVAKKLQEMGYDFTPGMKTPFIITNGSAQPQKAEPVIEGVEFTARPDYRYYAERLAMALARITEPFGCDERSLMQGNAQRSLESFAAGKPAPRAEAPAPPTGAKRVKQTATLDMFL